MVCDDRGTVTIEGDLTTVVSEAVHLLEKVLEVSYKAVPLEERAYMRKQIFHALSLVIAETIRDMKQIDAESESETATGAENAVDLTDLLREVMTREDQWQHQKSTSSVHIGVIARTLIAGIISPGRA